MSVSAQHRWAMVRRQRGVSLVELMVALVLGAVITVGIINLFTANRATYQLNMGQARLQENARFALEFITSSMRMAGYRGCSNNAPLLNVLQGSAQLVDQFDIAEAFSGHSGGGGAWTPALTSLPDDIDSSTIQPGTDVLVLRSVLDDGVRFTGVDSGSSDESLVTLPDGCDEAVCPGYEAGQVVLASDCLQGAITMLTASAADVGAGTMRLTHANATTIDGISNSDSPIAQLGRAFNTEGSLFRLGSDIFYIAPIDPNAPGAGINNVDDPILALWRKRGQEAPVELVEGVVGLTLRYGEDTTGDRVPNRYRPIHEITDLSNIATIRVSIAVSSVNAVVEGEDGPEQLLRDFTQTVALRNRI